MDITFQPDDDFASLLRTSGFEDYSAEYNKLFSSVNSAPRKAYCWNSRQYTRRKIVVFAYGQIELLYGGISVFSGQELPLKVFINFAASQEHHEIGKTA